MLLKKEEFKKMFTNAAVLWQKESGYLSEIDSKFGDGDHGITIKKIADLIISELQGWEEESIADFIEKLGEKTMAINGGSAGPLYGTMIGGMALAISDKEEITAEDVKAMLKSSLSEMQDITTAKVGDKTMMDSLILAVKEAELCSGDPIEVLKAAKAGAEKGAKDSENYVSKFGRAKSYKEQTIGTPDAGAVSTALFFTGLAEAL